MAKKVNDEEKAKIIADYIEYQSYNKVGKIHGRSANTIKNIVLSDPEFAQKCTDKKGECEKNVLKHMEEQSEKICTIFDRYLEELLDRDKIKKSSAVQLSTVIGTLFDKMVVVNEKSELNRSEIGGIAIVPEQMPKNKPPEENNDE